MATTTNFGWTTPNDTDLVKDGAAAIRTALNGVDTSFVDLKGGTTGQILAKASNTDLDYSWVANDTGDITGVTAGTGISGGGTSGTVTVTNSMATAITTAGDLIKGTGSGTFDRLGIGTTGQILTVAAGVPAWSTPASSGGMTLLSTTALSGATTITVSSISQDYTNLLVVMNGFYATSSSNFFVKFNNTNLTTWTGNRNVDGTSANFNSGSSVNSIDNGWSIYAGTAGSGDGNVATSYALEIPNYSDTSGQKNFTMYGGGVTAGSTNYSSSIMSGRYAGNTGINRLDFTMSSNFATGTVKIWGIK